MSTGESPRDTGAKREGVMRSAQGGVVIGLVAALAGSAAAAPIAVDFRGTGLGTSASVSFHSGNSSAFSNRGLFVGQLLHTLGTGPSARDFVTYCIDLTQYAGDGQFDLVGLRSAPVTNPAPSNQWEMNQGQADALNALYHAFHGSVDTNAEAAAFQAAIWEITFDWSTVDGNTFSPGDTSNLTGGVVQVHNNVSNTLYAGYLNAAVGRANTRSILGAIVSDSQQDQLLVIPLPSAGLMAGAGVLALGSRRRRALA